MVTDFADQCLGCGHWPRLGPDARKDEDPRWCGECNFDRVEFRRLQAQDRVLGQPVRNACRPARDPAPTAGGTS